MSSETNNTQKGANEGIRLPPISFLAGAHPTHTQLASIVSPIHKPSPEKEDTHQHTTYPMVQGDEGRGEAMSEKKESKDSEENAETRVRSIHQLHHHHPNSGHLHHHHHHHHPPLPYPHHHHHRHERENDSRSSKQESSASPQPQAEDQRVTKRMREEEPREFSGAMKKKQVDALLKTIKEFLAESVPERNHLGSLTYNPTATWDSVTLQQLHGLDSHEQAELKSIQDNYISRREEGTDEKYTTIPWLPKLSAANVNKTLSVKIQYKHIKEFVENFTLGKIQRKRELWGGLTGLYTDDSDLLSVLCHLGLFDNCLDLREWNEGWVPADIVRPLQVEQDSDGVDLLDLTVTILLLPGLSRYQGFFKNGINSRTWASESRHDGLSFAVYSVKWETFVSDVAAKSNAKLAQAEFVADREASKKNFQESKGWVFDYAAAKCGGERNARKQFN